MLLRLSGLAEGSDISEASQVYEVPSTLKTAMKGLEVVTGIAVEHLIHPEHAPLVERDLASWQGVQRGSDVFVTGLPRFNIEEVYSKAIGIAFFLH
jgi:hypothetical protein